MRVLRGEGLWVLGPRTQHNFVRLLLWAKGSVGEAHVWFLYFLINFRITRDSMLSVAPNDKAERILSKSLTSLTWKSLFTSLPWKCVDRVHTFYTIDWGAERQFEQGAGLGRHTPETSILLYANTRYTLLLLFNKLNYTGVAAPTIILIWELVSEISPGQTTCDVTFMDTTC